MFTQYRTFFFMFGILIFFLMLFVQSYNEGFKGKYFTTNNTYEKGESVNINGEFNNYTEKYKRYNNFGPFAKNITADTCQFRCNRQDECNALHGNKCESSFDPNSKLCFCSFSKKTI